MWAVIDLDFVLHILWNYGKSNDRARKYAHGPKSHFLGRWASEGLRMHKFKFLGR